MNNVLLAGIDGMQFSYVKDFGIDFYENKLKDESAVVRIPKPSKIEEGEIGTASSPRLWSRYFTGVPAPRNGIAGFWEKMTKDGDILRAQMTIEKMRETSCEKLVDREDLLVKPLWTVLLENSKEIGLVTAWFSYPLQDSEIEMMGEDSFVLTDFPFPREKLDPIRNFYPKEAEPKPDFEDQVGAGARLPKLIHEDGEEVVRRMKQQDMDRYEYTAKQLEDKSPNFVGIYTRGVDGMQHILNNQKDNWTKESGFVQEGEAIEPQNFATPKDLKEIYEMNFKGIEKVWKEGNFDTLIIVSDHGSDILEGGPAHEWPAYAIIYGDFPEYLDVQGHYEDVPATVLDLMDIDLPDYYEGKSLVDQADVGKKLKDLGYLG